MPKLPFLALFLSLALLNVGATVRAQVQPELVPQLEYEHDGILLAPRADSGQGQPRARLLTQSDSQTYGNVMQWRDPQSGAVLKTVPLAARPSISDMSSSPVSTALSPQGDILANVGPSKVLFWQNPWSGAVLGQFPHQSYPLAFAPDGQKFVSQQIGNEEKPSISLIMREVPQGRVLHELALPGRANTIIWSPQNTRLGAISFVERKQDVRVWDAASGRLEWQAPIESTNVLRAWFLPDGRLAILDGLHDMDSTTLRVRLWPIGGGDPNLTSHVYRFTDPDVRWAILDDGRLLHSEVQRTAATKPNQGATERRVTFVWDVPKMAAPRLLKPTEAALTAGAPWQGQHYAPPPPFPTKLPSPVGLKRVRLVPGRVVVADDSRIWEATTGRLRGEFQPIPPRASAISIAPDGKFFASAGGGGGGSSGGAFLGVWDATRKLLWHKAVSLTLNNGGPFAEVGNAWTTALAFSPDGERLLVASAFLDQPPLAFYQTRTGKLLWSTKRTVAGVGFDASGAALSDDGKSIAVTSSTFKEFSSPQVQIVGAAAGAVLSEWKMPTPVYVLSWSRDKNLLALATASGKIVKEERHSFFDDDEQLVELREPLTGNLQQTLRGAKSQMQALRFSPDGAFLAGAGRDGNIYLWDVQSGQLLHTLTGHLSAAADVMWNGNAQLVSVGADGTARFWNATRGRLLATALFLQPAKPEPKARRNTRNPNFGGGQFETLLPTQWLLTTPDGFYDASPGAEKYLRWRVGTQLVPAARFKARFHQPARVRAALNAGG